MGEDTCQPFPSLHLVHAHLLMDHFAEFIQCLLHGTLAAGEPLGAEPE